MLLEWRKTEDKDEVVKQMHNLLFKKKEQVVNNKLAKKVEGKYTEIKAEIAVGSRVKLKKNFQVGDVKEIRGKRAIVQVGLIPMSVEISDLVVVEEKE
jgi:DNA mismatch repair protein MutS2